MAARLSRADPPFTERLVDEAATRQDWVFEGLRSGGVQVIEESGGHPNRYLARAKDCPLLDRPDVPPQEWVYVVVWDES